MNQPYNGIIDVSTRLHTQDGNLTIQRTQDCTPIAERAKKLHNEGFHGTKEMKHAASIPNVIVEKYINERGITFAEFMADEKHIKAIVEDPANAAFRIWPGRI